MRRTGAFLQNVYAFPQPSSDKSQQKSEAEIEAAQWMREVSVNANTKNIYISLHFFFFDGQSIRFWNAIRSDDATYGGYAHESTQNEFMIFFLLFFFVNFRTLWVSHFRLSQSIFKWKSDKLPPRCRETKRNGFTLFFFWSSLDSASDFTPLEIETIARLVSFLMIVLAAQYAPYVEIQFTWFAFN